MLMSSTAVARKTAVGEGQAARPFARPPSPVAHMSHPTGQAVTYLQLQPGPGRPLRIVWEEREKTLFFIRLN